MRLKWKFKYCMSQLSTKSAKQIHNVYMDGFELTKKSWSIEGIKRAYKDSTLMGTLNDVDGDIFGYTFYYVPKETFKGQHFIWNNATCLRKECQGKGYYSLGILKQVMEMFPEFNFGWTGGRSQNPKIYLRYKKIGYCYPLDEPYNKSEIGKNLIEFMRMNIQEVSKVKNFNNHYGIAFKAYSTGELGSQKDNMKIEGVSKIEKKLLKWNFNRLNGDALVVSAKIKNTNLCL